MRYTNAYAMFVPASHTLILACLDKALTPQDLEKVAAFERRETTGVTLANDREARPPVELVAHLYLNAVPHAGGTASK